MNAKIRLRKLNNTYQEYDLKQGLSFVPIFLFFAIFYDFREIKYVSRYQMNVIKKENYTN